MGIARLRSGARILNMPGTAPPYRRSVHQSNSLRTPRACWGSKVSIRVTLAPPFSRYTKREQRCWRRGILCHEAQTGASSIGTIFRSLFTQRRRREILGTPPRNGVLRSSVAHGGSHLAPAGGIMLQVADPILPARRTMPMPGDEQDKAGVLAPPPLIYLGARIFGLLLGRRFPMRFLPPTMARGLGWPLLGGGVLLAGWFELAMRQADTPSNPYKPVERIATEGPFRYTRNPGYLAMTLIYAGIASLANALWAILLLPVVLVVIRRGVIEREERYLEGKFGEEYLSYKARVRRWI